MRLVIALFAGILLGLGIVATTAGYINQSIRNYNNDQRLLKHYHEKYLFKSGWDKKHGSYQLASLDGGKNWYAIDAQQGEVKILEAADTVFPGIIQELNAQDQLIDHVHKHGPLNLRNPKDLELLTSAGFSVAMR